MKIGNKIKELRRKSNMTQEQLAELIGISFQAVSKWETCLGLPDITLIPKLASIFGVTTDCLFDYSLTQIAEDVERYVDHSFLCRESDPAEGRRILEEGLAKYPDHEILLNNLLYVLNYTENPDETLRIAAKLIDKTDEPDIKYDALRFMSYAYAQKGDLASAVAALEQIPEIYFTKLSEMAYVLSGDAKRQAAEKQKWLSFEMLLQMLWRIAEVDLEEKKTDEAIKEIQRALRLLSAFEDEASIGNFEKYKLFFEEKLKKME